MSTELCWGVCATVKADADEILEFAAYHLDAGAHRLWIYLDAPCPEAQEALAAHPKCRVVRCDDIYWTRVFGRRPTKHQVRQTLNATRTYNRAGDVDWLLHADVDEFLVSQRPVTQVLEALPEGTLSARIRPMEALAADSPHYGPRAFKKFVPAGPDRNRIVDALYPAFGPYLKGGFLSHVAGKVFVRTGLSDVKLRIHNVFQGEEMNPSQADLRTMALAHTHAVEWSQWRAHFDYRFEKGAYRSDLAAARPENEGGITLHAFLTELLAEEGEAGLRAFFDAVAADTPELRGALDQKGLLAIHDLKLDAKRQRLFPDDMASVSTV